LRLAFELSTNLEGAMSGLVVFVWVALMVWVTVWDTRRRKKMTPNKRRQDDEAMRFDQSVW
jgi:hypothetical protein